MPQSNSPSLWRAAVEAGNLEARFMDAPGASVRLADLCRGSVIGDRLRELRGRCVMLATRDQLASALAMLELDGIARRLVLCPPDLAAEHFDFVASTVEADVMVSDRAQTACGTVPVLLIGRAPVEAADYDRSADCATEWVLLTSGTTGRPKMVQHSLASLVGAIAQSPAAQPVVWSTFYDIRRYGGLQIFLRAMIAGTSLVLSDADESTAAFLERAGLRGITHISGTPSHWRRALMSPAADRIEPAYVRLSGEIADQAILDHLQTFYPQAGVAHAFASTEAGVGFEVRDGFAGFPENLVEQRGGAVEIKVEDGILKIRSDRRASRYLGPDSPAIADAEGFVATGDVVELRNGRYYFAGRKDGVINIGGQKVYPEEVEAVINRHPQVRMSCVRTRKNPITGALVVADVVLLSEAPPQNDVRSRLENEIRGLCQQGLSRHKVPAVIRFVPSVALAASGKVIRSHA